MNEMAATSARSTIRALLVDDEPPALLGLRALLRAHADVTVVGEASGGAAALAAARALAPDLLLLDVQMPEVDGFAVVEGLLAGAVHAPVPIVLFITAHDRHALRAFDVGAVDYLLKPVSDARFALAMERVRALRATADARELVARLTRVLSARQSAPQPEPPLEHIAVRIGRHEHLVPAAEIDWLEADGYCAAVHHAGRRLVIRQTLQAFEAQLDPRSFVRIHRSAIVRLGAIASLERTRMGRLAVVLRSGHRLLVSRARHADVLARVGRGR